MTTAQILRTEWIIRDTTLRLMSIGDDCIIVISCECLKMYGIYRLYTKLNRDASFILMMES